MIGDIGESMIVRFEGKGRVKVIPRNLTDVESGINLTVIRGTSCGLSFLLFHLSKRTLTDLVQLRMIR